jgi:hypothetical protein
VAACAPSVASAVSAAKPSKCTIKGSGKADKLKGTPAADVICARGGNDRVTGVGSGDRVIAGHGDDSVYGGRGSDYLYGGPGDDLLDGGPGNDVIDGGRGEDHCQDAVDISACLLGDCPPKVVKPGCADMYPPSINMLDVTPVYVDASAGPASAHVSVDGVHDYPNGVTSGYITAEGPGGSVSPSLAPSAEWGPTIWEADIEFTPASAPGIYEVTTLVLVDPFGNRLNWNPGPLANGYSRNRRFEVGVTPDLEPPELTNVTFVPEEIDTSTSGVRVGIAFDVSDDVSGVREACYMIHFPGGGGSGTCMNLFQGTVRDGTYLHLPLMAKGSPRGRYEVSADITDGVGNVVHYSSSTLEGMGLKHSFEQVGEGGSAP